MISSQMKINLKKVSVVLRMMYFVIVSMHCNCSSHNLVLYFVLLFVCSICFYIFFSFTEIYHCFSFGVGDITLKYSSHILSWKAWGVSIHCFSRLISKALHSSQLFTEATFPWERLALLEIESKVSMRIIHMGNTTDCSPEGKIPFIRNRVRQRKSILQDHENLGKTKVDLFI